MPNIRDVKIETIEQINIPPVRSIFTGLPEPVVNQVSPPVTVTIGSPIVNIPGCVEANPNGPGLVKDDPNGNVTLCDGQVPSFNPINYEPNNLILTGPPEPAPKIKNESVELPKAAEIPQKQIPNIPIISVEKKEKEIEIVEEPTFVEKYLPTAQEISTTVTIATAAATAAVFGKPLAELLLRLIKPVIKKSVEKLKSNIGVKSTFLSVAERRQLQRDLRK